MAETARTVGKRVNQASLIALKEALTAIYWFKSDLESFIRGCVEEPQILGRLNFSEQKWFISSRLVDVLAANQDAQLPTLLTLMSEVSSFEDFSHLARLEDGAAKVARAKQAVAALKKQYDAHAGLVAEKAEIEKRREAAQADASRRDALQASLDTLRQEYVALLPLNPHERGYRLQHILRELFSFFDLDPKASFALEGEQIDGAFSFDGSDYLLEAKWQKDPVEPADLRDFDGKIKNKLKTTLGLFVAINDFTPGAVKTHSRVGASMMLMTGEDLYAVVDGRLPLPEVLRRKRRHASQTGDILLRVRDF